MINYKKQKRYLLFLLINFLAIQSFSQVDMQQPLKKPIAELPVRSLEAAGLNGDTIQKYLELIRNTPLENFRGLVVIKDVDRVVE